MNNPSKNTTIRSILAVAAGIFANFIIAVPIDALLHAMGFFPPDGLIHQTAAVAISYRLVAAVVGGYLVARLAPQNPMKHALILGVIGVVMSSLGAWAMWDKGPAWYSLTLVAVSIPCSLIGAKLYTRYNGQ